MVVSVILYKDIENIVEDAKIEERKSWGQSSCHKTCQRGERWAEEDNFFYLCRRGILQ